jgi:hypothetical protein
VASGGAVVTAGALAAGGVYPVGQQAGGGGQQAGGGVQQVVTGSQ